VGGLPRAPGRRGGAPPDETEISPESPESTVRGGAGHGGSTSGSGRSNRGDAEADSGVELDVDVAPDRTDATAADDAGASTPRTEPSDADAGSTRETDGTDDPADGSDGDSSGTGARTVDPESDDAWTVSSGGSAPDPGGGDGRRSPDAGGALGDRSSAHATASGSNVDADRDDATPQRDRSPDAPTGVVAPTVQRDLTGDAATLDPDFESLPSMRVLGQLHDTYVVAETDSGLLLIDQHAADERVNYERLRAELDGDVATQALAEPVDVELTAREAALFGEYRDALAELGFRTERVDDRTVAVRSVPAVFASALSPELLRDVLSAFVSEGDGGEAVASVADELLADLACYPSVTGNTSLTEGSVVELLEALDECENPYACPHGRPVVVAVDGEEIESRFERDYPGHGGRRGE
jgi:DNA mismatch repair protein MutL